VDEFEHLFVFWKPGIVEVDRRRLSAQEWSAWGSRGVWRIPSVARNRRHEAEFPEELAERVVRLFSDAGDVVLDPFCGSGATLAVAKRHQRRYIGLEIGDEYAALAARRMNAPESGIDNSDRDIIKALAQADPWRVTRWRVE